MAYGTVKVDNITFTNGGSDQTITVSGIVSSISGNITATGTIQAATVIGTTVVSGTTVTGTTGSFATANAGTITATSGTIDVATFTSGIISSGTASNPSLSITGDPNTGVWAPAADTLAVSTNGEERLRVTAVGRLGVGTDSPIARLHVSNGEANAALATPADDFYISSSGDTGMTIGAASNSKCSIYFGESGVASDRGRVIYDTNDDSLQLATANAERCRIDSSGRVLVGATAARTNLSSATDSPFIQLEGTSFNTSCFSATRCSANASGATTVLAKSRSASVGGNTVVVTGDTIGTHEFQGNDGTSFVRAASVSAAVDGTVASGSVPARFVFSTTPSGGTIPIERMRITSSGGVGIGATAPRTSLHVVKSGSFDETNSVDTTSLFLQNISGVQGSGSYGAGITFSQISGSRPGFAISSVQTTSDPDQLGGAFFVHSSSSSNDTLLESMRLGADGRLFVALQSGGMTNNVTAGISPMAQITSQSSTSNGLGVYHWVTGTTSPAYLLLSKARSGTAGSHTSGIVLDGDDVGAIYFNASDGTQFLSAARIIAEVDGTPGSGDMPGRLTFLVTRDGASSPTTALIIYNRGDASHTSTGNVNAHQVTNQDSSTYASAIYLSTSARAASSAYSLFLGRSSGGADNEVQLRGDGSGFCDGTWNGGGADYAEYFEWSDGNTAEEDRRGIAVVLDNEKIRPATQGENPIGVISGNPSVIGDTAWNKWNGKYLRDDYGSYILDQDGYRILNPNFDPDLDYVPREKRKEWACVGLVGKLRIRKGQPVGTNWLKMRDVSSTVEEWLVR